MATCYIASLKHAPGSYKEFRLMAEKLRAHGHDVRLLLTSEYRGMHESDLPTEYVVERTASAKDQLSDFARLSVPLLRGAHVEFFRDSPPDMLCCYNFHPLNLPLLLAARRARRQSLRFLFLHEPFYEFKREVYGAKQAGLLWLMEMGLRSMIFASNRVVVPSMNAARLLRRLLPILPLPVHVQSLVAPDHNPLLDRERSHVAFVGKMDNAKGKLDLFGQILERAASRRVDLRFAVLTAADLTGYLSALSPEARALVDFSHGSPVSDEQIVEMLSRSMATLLLHTHLSQSGVVPMSYMCGTPVVARDLPGARQDVRPGQTGLLLDRSADVDEWIDALVRISAMSPAMIGPSRSYYEERFSPETWDRQYEWLLAELSALDRQAQR